MTAKPDRPARRVMANSGWLAVFTFSNIMLGVLIFPYLSRVLSVEGFGLVGFGMAFVVVFQAVVEYGYTITATREISQHRDNPTRLGAALSTILVSKVILAAVSATLFFTLVLLVEDWREILPTLALFVLSSITVAFVPDYYFRGVERMRSISLRALLSRSVSFILIVLFVRDDSTLYFVPLSLFAGNFLSVVLGYALIRRGGIRLSAASIGEVVASIYSGVGYFVSRIATTINQSAGAVILGLQYAPLSVQLGMFSAASRISSVGDQAITPVTDGLYPHMTRTRDYGLFWRIYSVGLLAWTIGCAGIFVWAEQICVFVLGEPYAAAGPLLQILAIGTWIAFSASMFGYVALVPLGLGHHANNGIVLASALGLVAYATLWITQSVAPDTVCWVMVGVQLVCFFYRFLVFVSARRKHRLTEPSTD